MSLLQQSFLRHHKSFLGRWCFFIRKKQKTKAQLVDGPGSIIHSGQLRKLQQCRIRCVTSSASQTHSSTYPNKGKRYQFNHQRELCFACLFFSFFCSRRNIGHLKKKSPNLYISKRKHKTCMWKQELHTLTDTNITTCERAGKLNSSGSGRVYCQAPFRKSILR